VHTAPPVPPFIHCAQDSLQPPLATPDQFRESDAASAHVPEAGLPNCWKIGAGAEEAELDEDDPPPPPPPLVIVKVYVQTLPLPDCPVKLSTAVPTEFMETVTIEVGPLVAGLEPPTALDVQETCDVAPPPGAIRQDVLFVF